MSDVEIWCEGCQQVKGIIPEDLNKLVGELGCCPVCDTQWTKREKQ